VGVGNRRSGNEYRTMTLRFYSGETPYQYEAGARYAIRFDIVTKGGHHSTRTKAGPFTFTGGAAPPPKGK
jgi:hypothetical protein